MGNKRGQVTIFIIVGILIVVAALLIYYFASSDSTQVPVSLDPAYSSYIACLDDSVSEGVDLLSTQGGYVDPTSLRFEPGSAYMPFSSQLDFYGNAVPYWYYVSGNNLEREQVPSISSMEQGLAQYVQNRISRCTLEEFEDEGYDISVDYSQTRVQVEILDEEIQLTYSLDVHIARDQDVLQLRSYQQQYDYPLGRLYDNALRIYEYEQETLFLERYGLDTLRMYAPVDGVEFSCAPLTWVGLNVSNTLQEALEANTISMKVEGDYYELQSEEDAYFVVPVEVDSDVSVQFLTSRQWPYALEVSPSEGELLIAEPIGNQQGLGILGFCYVPYHFVYDVKYPVMIQVHDATNPSEEFFQFPMAVVIAGNQPRKPLQGSTAVAQDVPDVCSYGTQEVHVEVFDSALRPVDGYIGFECLGVQCNIGETESGELTALFPQCSNGQVLVRSEGYAEARYTLSTNTESQADIQLHRSFPLNVDIRVDGLSTDLTSTLTITDARGSQSIYYPDQQSVVLSEGEYSVQLTVYDESSLTLEETTIEQCYDVPRGGLGGYVGLTKQECADIPVPETTLTQVPVAGGSGTLYVTESMLASSRNLVVSAESIIRPTSIEALQTTYTLYDQKEVEVTLQ